MTRSTPFRFPLFEISFAILAALALALSPQAALAQHGGGGGHAGGGGHIGGGGGSHFSGGGGHATAGFGTGGHSSVGSHVSSLIHVFSGPRSEPAAVAPARAAENSAALMNERARASANQPGSSNISASPASGLPHGSGEAAAPMHTTIGFPPSTDPRVVSIASAHRGAPLMFTGQGQQLWQSSRDAAANRDSAGVNEIRVRRGVFPKPPHVPRRPILGGSPFLFGSPGFAFFNPGFGFFGPGFGCDPFWTPSFGCNGYGYGGFGYGGYGYGGYGYGGYGNYLGAYGDIGYGYDNGYYAPPSFDVTPPNPDEGASQEPAPSEWQNPPDGNSGPDNSGVENAGPAPDTVIYLKDGTSFAVKNYWIADGQLHYVTSYGGENAVDLGAFDLQRTTDENSKQGIAITLRPAPEAQPPAAQPPNAQPPAANPAPEGTPR